MKIGIISDIHSNIDALNAVLNEFDKLKVYKIICCGDIVGIGINPEETIQTLIKKKDILITVVGNHENYLLKGLPKTVHDDNRKMSDEEIGNHKWNQSLISEQSKKFLGQLDISKIIEIEKKKIYIVHYPIKKDGTYKKIIKFPTAKENKEMFKDIEADIYLYGHTHTTSINVENDKWYVNIGSLGCPKDSNIATAGILEINDGKVEFKEINVKYNVKRIIEEINNLKFPFYKKILKIFYGIKN